jgi:hypothetical protein
MACGYAEYEHVGDSQGKGKTAIQGQHDALALGAQDGLTDEVKDSALGGEAQNSRV